MDSFSARFAASPQDHVEREGGGQRRGNTEVRIQRLRLRLNLLFEAGTTLEPNSVSFGGQRHCGIWSQKGSGTVFLPRVLSPLECRPFLDRREVVRDHRHKVETRKEKTGVARRGRQQQEKEGTVRVMATYFHVPPSFSGMAFAVSIPTTVFALLTGGQDKRPRGTLTEGLDNAVNCSQYLLPMLQPSQDTVPKRTTQDVPPCTVAVLYVQRINSNPTHIAPLHAGCHALLFLQKCPRKPKHFVPHPVSNSNATLSFKN